MAFIMRIITESSMFYALTILNILKKEIRQINNSGSCKETYYLYVVQSAQRRQPPSVKATIFST